MQIADINKDNPIESGLFELIKNIYNHEELSCIELSESGDNQILINSKKLKDITNENTIIENALDIELGGRTSVFMQTEKITEKEKFFWTGDQSDRYSDTDFLVDKLVEVAKRIGISKSTTETEIFEKENEFFAILKVADQELIKSDEFKLSILKTANTTINHILIRNNQSDIFSIDFSADYSSNFIKECIEKNDFKLLTSIFEHNIAAKKQNSYDWVKERVAANTMKFKAVHDIAYSDFINQPNTIQYLIQHREAKLGIFGEDESFSIVSSYPYFNNENKLESTIVNKFLDSIIKDDYSNRRIDQIQLSRIPKSLYNESYFLERVCFDLDYNDIKRKLKYNDIEPKLLSDTDFIVKCCKIVPDSKLINWISTFISPENLTKKIVIDLVNTKPTFCEYVLSDKYFKDFANDKEIIINAVNNGFNITRISNTQMRNFFLEDDSEEFELIKVKYLIESEDFLWNRKQFKSSEDNTKYIKKYYKPEYMYFSKGDSFYGNKNRWVSQSKIKTVEEVLDILNKIRNFPYKYKFRADFFYKELPNKLQANKKIVDTILDLKETAFPFSDLHESLQYNSELALKFIKQDPKNTLDIPKEFFNDINFSLEFAKLIDKKLFHSKESIIPEFITKFFDNQGIKDNYHEKLQYYVSVFSLKEALDQKPIVQNKKKKIKI